MKTFKEFLVERGWNEEDVTTNTTIAKDVLNAADLKVPPKTIAVASKTIGAPSTSKDANGNDATNTAVKTLTAVSQANQPKQMKKKSKKG